MEPNGSTTGLTTSKLVPDRLACARSKGEPTRKVNYSGKYKNTIPQHRDEANFSVHATISNSCCSPTPKCKERFLQQCARQERLAKIAGSGS